jgi:CBS domain-containing protein
MGILTTAAGFGAGYIAGATTGSRLRRAVGRGRDGSADTGAAGSPGGTGSASGAAPSAGERREVRQVMTAAPQSVPLSATIADAAKLMQEHDIGDVVVVEDGSERIVGIVTDRDVAVRGVGAGHDPRQTSVREICTPDPATVRPDATIADAARAMRSHDVRRLPVVESGVAIGVVSLGDLAGTEESVTVLDDVSAAPPNS